MDIERATNQFDASKHNTTWHNLRMPLLSSKIVQLRNCVINLACVDLFQQRYHICVQHWCKEVGMQRRMPESLLELMTAIILLL